MPSTHYFLSLFLIFVRVLSILMTAPIFSHRGLPSTAKIGLAGLVSLLLLPVETAGKNMATAWPQDLLPFLMVIAQEVLIGLLIGFAGNLVFAAIDIAAKIIGLQIGFQTASLFDPLTNAPTSALEQFYMMTALMVFLVLDGHHWLIIALARTFEIAPLGTFVLTSLTFERLLVMTNEAFVAGLRISLPIIGALMLTDLGLGLLARAVPQIQVFFLGLPLKMGLGFLMLALTLSVSLPFLKDLLAGAASNMLVISGQ